MTLGRTPDVAAVMMIADKPERVDSPPSAGPWPRRSPMLAWWTAGVLFVLLFWPGLASIAELWWTDPDSGHGLLLAPVAVVLAWRSGVRPGSEPRARLGAVLLSIAVVLRLLGGLSGFAFMMRFSALLAVVALIVSAWGIRQLLHWWLPLGLVLLSIPLPTVVLSALALPLQLQASKLGTALLEWRDVPVLLTGNVINLPGHQLFVTEACSGLRSLSALLAIGLLIGGMWLRHPALRILLLILSVPVAIALNSLRVFLTGFLVFYVDPAMGEGLMHYTEGWVIFTAALLIQAGVAWLLVRLDPPRKTSLAV